ncbi:hypothetical protein D7Y13_44235 [Corallococcus praedator]|uniref:Hermes trasposase DNA-binding domain-containing protein n=1 Tax=Corallococcus praedator TaxID=2316724 RepID=A0ABX9Q2V9_9BACT|nr:hypothetical protein D7Y13_44235 [Corallococcus praedator]
MFLGFWGWDYFHISKHTSYLYKSRYLFSALSGAGFCSLLRYFLQDHCYRYTPVRQLHHIRFFAV